MKKCQICGKFTRYNGSDEDYEYWFSICKHIPDYWIDRNTGEELNVEGEEE